MKLKSTLGGAIFIVLVLVLSLGLFGTKAKADTPSVFSLIVTPSPLIATVNPGEASLLQLKILNNGTGTENLQIQAKSFSVNNNNGQININDAPPIGISSWISYSAPKFTLTVGQWETENINLSVPKNAGFSYSFILLISRQNSTQQIQSGQILKGSLAVFTLINVNQPGAVRRLSVVNFTVSKHIYEWLPVSFTIKFENTGNTIVLPYGNIFIGRSSNSKTPISTILVNPNGGYILPSTSRAYSEHWNKGFPVYETITTSTGAVQQHLTWNWTDLSEFRIGRYTANLVAVYNNGYGEVPITAQISFWVIPWKALSIAIVFSMLLLVGIWSLLRLIYRIIKRYIRRIHPSKTHSQQ